MGTNQDKTVDLYKFLIQHQHHHKCHTNSQCSSGIDVTVRDSQYYTMPNTPKQYNSSMNKKDMDPVHNPKFACRGSCSAFPSRYYNWHLPLSNKFLSRTRLIAKFSSVCKSLILTRVNVPLPLQRKNESQNEIMFKLSKTSMYIPGHTTCPGSPCWCHATVCVSES